MNSAKLINQKRISIHCKIALKPTDELLKCNESINNKGDKHRGELKCIQQE